MIRSVKASCSKAIFLPSCFPGFFIYLHNCPDNGFGHMDFVPRHDFDARVRRHGGDSRPRGFSCERDSAVAKGR
jgi:hypothetical protein